MQKREGARQREVARREREERRKKKEESNLIRQTNISYLTQAELKKSTCTMKRTANKTEWQKRPVLCPARRWSRPHTWQAAVSVRRRLFRVYKYFTACNLHTLSCAQCTKCKRLESEHLLFLDNACWSSQRKKRERVVLC
jgi:hypothetical protein